jgi:hypothetical protein
VNVNAHWTYIDEAKLESPCRYLADSDSEMCNVTTAAENLNNGVNAGGCFMCETAPGVLASGEQLEELFKQTCLADVNWKAFETAHPGVERYYNCVTWDGRCRP